MSKQSYKNLTSIPTWKLKEILDSHHTVGIDGADYAPVKEELEQELWRRNDSDSLKELKDFDLKQKELFKYSSKSHKNK